MSPAIGEALALDAPQRLLGSGLIFDAELGTVAVAEIELSKIAVQMLL